MFATTASRRGAPAATPCGARDDAARRLVIGGGDDERVAGGGGFDQLRARAQCVEMRKRPAGAGEAGHMHVEGFRLARDLLTDRAAAQNEQALAREIVEHRRHRVARPCALRAGAFGEVRAVGGQRIA